MSFKALLVAALSLLPFAAGSPASADVPIGLGAGPAGQCSGLHCWSAVITANIQPIGNTGLALVSWDCQATGTIDPASTGVGRCSVGTQNAPSITLPGAYAATAGASVFVVGSSLQACVGGQSTFIENVLGDQTVGDTRCFPILIARIDI